MEESLVLILVMTSSEILLHLFVIY
jgi:hypothetical protein